uniref:Cytochrome c oxidase subunit 7A2 n=1 Tax=Astyanax mexicanus TaxID=7994 RepID=A0A8B9L4Z5_ASTMX
LVLHIGSAHTVIRPTIFWIVLFYIKNFVFVLFDALQADNGLPVHLKGGASDAVLYRATMGLTVMGTLFVLYELGKAALPQKKE